MSFLRPGVRSIALLLLVTALFYWKLGFSNRFTFLDSPDLVGQVLPWYEMESKAWKDGIFPLWDPYVFSGQPTLGQMQPGAAFPLNWPLFAAQLDDAGHIRFRLLHLQRFLIQLLAALLAYGLARELGRSRLAALLVGLAFSCVGALPSFGWPQVINGAIWLPLTLLLFHRTVRQTANAQRLAWAALCGGSVGMSLLSGHHQTPFYSLLALGAACGFFLWEHRQADRRETAWTGAAFVTVAAVALAVSALQLVPAFEYAAQVYRWIGTAAPIEPGGRIPYYVHTQAALHPIDLVGLVTPRQHDGANIFVGWTVMVLALYGAVGCWRERWVRGYSLLALATTAYALGGSSLFHGLIYHFVPTAEAVRGVDRVMFVAQLSLFVLAAYGLDRLMSQTRPELKMCAWLGWTQRILLFYVAVVYAASLFMGMKGELGSGRPDLFAIGAGAALSLIVLLEAYKREALSARVMGLALTALLLCESYSTQYYDFSEMTDPSRRTFLDQYHNTYTASMQFLQRRAEAEDRFRIRIVPDGAGLNLGALYGLEQSDGYLVTVNQDLFNLIQRIGWYEAFDLLNTRYTVARERHREDQQEVFADPNGLKVFLNPKAGPRAWMEFSNEFISDNDFQTANLPGVGGCTSEGKVGLTDWTIQSTKLDVDTPCSGYVVLADPYFVGWEAAVNGQAATILRYRGGLRAVWVPAGRSQVDFRYRPRSVLIGASFTALGFLLCCVAGAWLYFRRAGPSAEPI